VTDRETVYDDFQVISVDRAECLQQLLTSGFSAGFVKTFDVDMVMFRRVLNKSVQFLQRTRNVIS